MKRFPIIDITFNSNTHCHCAIHYMWHFLTWSLRCVASELKHNVIDNREFLHTPPVFQDPGEDDRVQILPQCLLWVDLNGCVYTRSAVICWYILPFWYKSPMWRMDGRTESGQNYHSIIVSLYAMRGAGKIMNTKPNKESEKRKNCDGSPGNDTVAIGGVSGHSTRRRVFLYACLGSSLINRKIRCRA